MKFETKAQKASFLMALLFMCLLGAGCASMVDDAIQNAFATSNYNDDVKYYRDRGVPKKTAEQAATEDQFFQSMQDTANKR